MSEPSEGERNPFAEIIDLFREAADKDTAPAADASGDAAAQVAPRTPAARGGSVEASRAVLSAATPPPPSRPAPTPAPRGGIPVNRAPRTPAPTPSRGRRLVLLLPVALLAVAGGATAAVLQHSHGHSPSHAAPAARPTASAPVLATPSVPTASAPPTGLPASGPSAAEAAYTAALDGFAAATDATSLRNASASAGPALRQLRRGGGRLHRAQARELEALRALARLDPTAGDASRFPALATAARTRSGAVTKAAAGRSDIADPSLATANVVQLQGAQVTTALQVRLNALAEAAAKAHLTAGLRAVAARAGGLAGTAGSTAGLLTGPEAARATAQADAFRALARLSAIDGDHLSAWSPLAAPLQNALAQAGISAASQDVAAISATISRAQQKLLAWAAANPTGAPAPSTTAGPTKRAIRAYASNARALLGRYTELIGTLPQVAPGQEPSFALTTQFYRTLNGLTSLAGSVGRLSPPSGMTGAQQALATLVARGRAAALAGHAVAVRAEDCDPTRRSCVYGSMRGWSSYVRAVGALGSPSAVSGILSKAESAALASAAGSAPTPSPAQPKPTV